MKPYERRESCAYPYFKLATWDGRSMTWRAGKSTVPSESAARSGARKPGRYRIERFDQGGSTVLEPFDV